MNTIRFTNLVKAFSLPELLVVATIVAIISGFAIPSYLGYTKKAKINALWEQVTAAKLAVESKYLKQNTAVSTITVNSGATEYTSSTNSNIQCITIQNGVVSVVGNKNSFENNIWISWVPDTSSGYIVWSCLYSEDAAPYLDNLEVNCTPSNTTSQFTTDAACN